MSGVVGSAPYRVGFGRGDITGPLVGQRFFGYGNPSQLGTGLHQRLYARAFVVEDGGSRIAMLHLDLGIATELLRHRILVGIERKLPGVFSPSHVLISATHTHAAPGGYSSYLLYASAVLGYAQRTIDRIVDGAVEAAVEAVGALRPGRVRHGVAELEGACINRSVEAFERNPEADQAALPLRYEPRMHQLSFSSEDDRPLALLNWFGVHGTSFNKHNRLVSGDNKGYASWLAEQRFGEGFVAGFVQGASADLSPNLRVAADGTLEGEGRDNRESAARIGARQAERAFELLERRGSELIGPVRAALAYVDFDGAEVPAAFTSTGRVAHVGPAVLGQSFIAGTKDGRGLDWVHEGMVDHRLQVRLMAKITGADEELVRRNHAPKLPFVRLSRGGPSAVPTRLPIQLLQIGEFAVAAVPFEVTTVAGLRLRRRVAEALGLPGTDRVALCALANAYASYLATPEEYDAQRYEGASTLFGREQLGFVESHLARLAAHLVAGTEPDSLPPPEPPPLYELTFGNADRDGADVLPPLVWFGDVFEDAPPETSPGDTVRATFWSCDPRHPPAKTSLFDVQRCVGEDWVTVVDDHAFETALEWTVNRGHARCTVAWDVPSSVDTGTYRFVHRGHRVRRDGVPEPFFGTSRVFEVVGEASRIDGIAIDAAPPLRRVPAADVTAARSRMELRRLRAGELVMEEGRVAAEMAWVLRGHLSVRAGGIELARLGPGDVVGELSFFDAQPRSASVLALEDVELLVLDQAAHRRLHAEGNAVAASVERLVLEALTTRLRRTDALLGKLSTNRRASSLPRARERLSSWIRGLDRRRRGWSSPPAVPVEAAIARTRLLGDLDEDTRQALGEWFLPHRAHPNEAICTQGQPGDELFLVASGRVEVYVDLGRPEPGVPPSRLLVGELGPGDIFGMTGLIGGRSRGATCIAVGSARLFSLARETWERRAFEATPAAAALRRAVIRAFCEQLRDTNRQLSGLDAVEPRGRTLETGFARLEVDRAQSVETAPEGSDGRSRPLAQLRVDDWTDVMTGRGPAE